MLDRIANRYHTDPASVLTWDPFRLALAVAAIDQALASRNASASGAEPMAVVDLGRW